MQFLMLVCDAPDAEPYVAEEDDIEAWGEELDKRGAWVAGNRLRPIEDAKLIRRRGGELLVTDGPFAEAKELIAGYDVLECDSLEEALELAARHPMARFGQIEVRAIWPWEGPEGA